MPVPHDQPPSLGIDSIGVPVEKLLDPALKRPSVTFPGHQLGRSRPAGWLWGRRDPNLRPVRRGRKAGPVGQPKQRVCQKRRLSEFRSTRRQTIGPCFGMQAKEISTGSQHRSAGRNGRPNGPTVLLRRRCRMIRRMVGPLGLTECVGASPGPATLAGRTAGPLGRTRSGPRWQTIRPCFGMRPKEISTDSQHRSAGRNGRPNGPTAPQGLRPWLGERLVLWAGRAGQLRATRSLDRPFKLSRPPGVSSHALRCRYRLATAWH